MKLVDNAALILRHAWSVRLMIVAAILSGLEGGIQVVIAFNVKLPIPGGLFAALATVVSCAALLARFVAQEKLQQKPGEP